MTTQAKKKTEPKEYRPTPDGPPYKPKDLWETGTLGKNKTYEGIKSGKIENEDVEGVTFISPAWAHRVLGWPA
jgi:hypothetical protein